MNFNDFTGAARRAAWRASGPMYLLSVFYVAMAGLALWGQSDGLMAWMGIDRIAALGIAAAIELLAAALFAFADWRRTYHGERALAARLLSVSVALGVAGMNFTAHVGSVGLCALYTGASLAGFAVLVLHTNARRRDALRAAGKLAATAPVYGVAQWLREPWRTHRARMLAVADPSLGVHGSLAAARTAIRLERRQAAIREALERKLRASVDGLTAQIAIHTYDLDEIAARLAAQADYDGLTALIAADLAPVLLTASASASAAGRASAGAPDRVDDADKAQPKPRSAGRGKNGSKPDAATRVRAVIQARPDATQAEIARAAHTTDRTVRRVLSALRADSQGALSAA